MSSKKMFFAVEAVLAALVIVSAVMMAMHKSGGESRKVTVIVSDSDDSQWSAFHYGLKMAAEDQKIGLSIVSTGELTTPEEEIEMINREIENGADAVIVQPVPGDNMEELLKKIDKKIPVMLVECAAKAAENVSALPVTGPDHYAMGEALAQELERDYNANLSGKTFGIVTENADTQAACSRRRGFEDALHDTGAKQIWSIDALKGETSEKPLSDRPKVDFVIALDDYSLTAAGECAVSNDLHGALVYGIGNSTEAFYYLDSGSVECLVVPDQFQEGYQSLTETAMAGQFFYKMKDREIAYTVIRKDELFTKENQEILFTMSQ